MQIFYDGWVKAISDARKDLKLHRIAQMLRDETVPLSMADRIILAELLVPMARTSKFRATLGRKVGRPPAKGLDNSGSNNFDFFEAVERYKSKHNTKKIPNAKFLAIGVRYSLRSLDACNTALKRGRKFAKEMAASTEY